MERLTEDEDNTMSHEQLITPSREEIVKVAKDWMQEVAPGKSDIDGYSEEELANIGLESLKLYSALLSLGVQSTETSDEEIKKVFEPSLKEFREIRDRHFSRRRRHTT